MSENWINTKVALLDLESELKCFLCQKLPVNPHILWCKHSFCKECILTRDMCPKCDLPVKPQELTPDIMLNLLLHTVKVTSEFTKCKNPPGNDNKNKNVTGDEEKIGACNDDNIKKMCRTPKQLKSSHEWKNKQIKISSATKSSDLDQHSSNRNDQGAVIAHTPKSTVKEKKSSIAMTPDSNRSKRTGLEMLTPKIKSKSNKTMSKSCFLYSAKKTHLPNKVNVKGETMLQIACRQGKLTLVQQLLKDGAEPNVKDYANWTPLCDAVGSGNIEVVRALLQAGAGVNTPSHLNTTALVEAVLKRDKAMVHLLMSYGADINQRTSFNNTALSIADDELKAVMTSASHVTIQPHPRVRTTPRAVLVTELPQEHIDEVLNLCKKFNLTLSTDFTEEITHIVVQKTGEVCEGSVPVMLGILSGCSVVGMDWVTACLQASCLVPVDSFQPSGTTDHPLSNVFHKARINRESLLPRLFDGCHISLQHDQRWPPDHKNNMVALVKAAGAHYQPREGDAERIPPDEQTVMFHTPPHTPLALVSHIILYQPGTSEPLLKYNMAHIKSYSVLWFLQCIKTFSIS